MLAIQKQPKYLRKTVRLPDGSLALVVFELQGTTWRAISGQIIPEAVSSNDILCLDGSQNNQLVLPVKSPYFAEIENLFKNLSFIVSQPTRAPNFA